MSEASARTYRLEPLDQSGVFLGLGVLQCVILGSGILGAVLAISAGAPVPVAAAPLLTAVGVAFGRIGGRAVWEWVPLLVEWSWAGCRRGRRWHAALPLWPTADPAPAPPCLEGLEIVAVDWRATGDLGAVRDHQRSTLTVAVPVTGPEFVVQPAMEQERLLAGWGDLLAQFAVERSVVAHLAWSDLARPAGLQEHTTWLDHHDRDTPHPEAESSYRELLQRGADATTSHEVVVTLTVARDRLGRQGGDAEDRFSRALVTSVEALLRGLRAAGLTAAEPLDPRALQRLVRLRIAPHATKQGPLAGRLADRLQNVVASTAGPLAVESRWHEVRVDAAWHRTWWIGSWPRLAVAPSWLEPFLAAGGITRAMTVVLVPVPTHQSRRRIERDLVKLDSDATTREEKGRRVDARHRRATQALLDREEELVAGYPEVAYAGLVTVSAPSLELLDAHGEIVEQLAREHGMDIRVLDARQDVAWAAALPLGLAPSTLLAS
jgi:hypothetical protein